MYFCTDTELPQPQTNASVSLVHFLQNIRPSVTLELERELLPRTPLHRLIITKGLPAYDTHSQTSLSVMIAPPEPSLSLRSLLANNSKGRCSWKLFLKMSGRLSRIIFVNEL